jgi:hypothetical protein
MSKRSIILVINIVRNFFYFSIILPSISRSILHLCCYSDYADVFSRFCFNYTECHARLCSYMRMKCKYDQQARKSWLTHGELVITC